MVVKALLIATVAIISDGSGAIEPASITQFKQEFKDGFGNVTDCRKVEASFHDGNGAITKRGNKLISRVVTPDGNHVTETTTFCVEY